MTWNRIYNFFGSIYELSEPNNKSRLQSMEGLRGFAIFLVFLCHYQDIILRNLPTGPFLTRIGMGVMEAGGTGVDLFFVLSGMLIYRAVLKPDLNYKRFMARRIERIYPAFIALFVFYVAADGLLSLRPHAAPYGVRIPSGILPAAGYLLANLLFLPGLFPIQPLMNVAWSLSYEWFFYLLLPLAIFVTGMTRWRPKTRIVLFFALSAVFLGSSLMFPAVFFMSSNPIRASHIKLIMFLSGMIISDLMLAGVDHTRRWLDWIALALLVGGLLVPFAIGYSGFRELPTGPHVARTEAVISGFLFAGYGLMVFCTLAGQHFFNRIFRAAPIRWLGNMSYSFYLIHGVPMHAVALFVARPAITNLPHGQLVLFIAILLPVTFVITAAVSTALFMLVEKPFSLKVKRAVKSANRNLQAVA
ncbi:MAG: acyltransferase [Bryobacteraceae bacterium]